MYDSSDMECNREIFVILDHFLPLNPTNNPKKSKFKKKMKKIPRDITISHICTINDNHMMYGFLDTEHIIFCDFGPIFVLLPPNNLKNQNFEKM